MCSPPAKRTMLLFATVLWTLTACANQTPTAETDVLTGVTLGEPQPATQVPMNAVPIACLAWKTITFDRLKDTLETISEVKASNAARAAYCGGA